MTLTACMAILTWVIAVVGIVGFWIALRRRVGWLVCVFQEVLYIGYGVGTKQYAFVVHAVLFGAVFARNWAKFHEVHVVDNRKRLEKAARLALKNMNDEGYAEPGAFNEGKVNDEWIASQDDGDLKTLVRCWIA
jgi:hypothetical protein